MKKYKIISECAERDSIGNATGRNYKTGEIITLSESEGIRLKYALCVVEIEEQIIRAPENRIIKRRPGRPRRT